MKDQQLIEIIEALVKTTESNKKKISQLQKQMKDYQSLVNTVEKIKSGSIDLTSVENEDIDQIKKELEMINARIEQHNDFFADLFQEQDDIIDEDIKVGDIVYIKEWSNPPGAYIVKSTKEYIVYKIVDGCYFLHTKNIISRIFNATVSKEKEQIIKA